MCFHSDVPNYDARSEHPAPAPSAAGTQWSYRTEGLGVVTYDVHPHSDGASYVFAAHAEKAPDHVFVFRFPGVTKELAVAAANAFMPAMSSGNLSVWHFLTGAESVYSREGVTTYDGRRFDASEGGVFA